MTTDEIIDAYNNGRIGFEKMVKLIEDDHAPTFTGSQWDTSVDKSYDKFMKASAEIRSAHKEKKSERFKLKPGDEFETTMFNDPRFSIGDTIASPIMDDLGNVYELDGYAYVKEYTNTTQYYDPNQPRDTYYTKFIVIANVK